jgi:hypothetical protein
MINGSKTNQCYKTGILCIFSRGFVVALINHMILIFKKKSAYLLVVTKSFSGSISIGHNAINCPTK